MSNRAWNYWVAATFFIGGLLVVAFNYFVDPYEVFGHSYLRSGYAVNERYRKVEHLLHDRHVHDAYILGSSVMGVFNPDTATKLTGHSFYNLSFLSGTPKEAFDALRALHRAGKPIKEVLVGLDFFTFYERPAGNSPMVRPHPVVSGESQTSFFGYYLFAPGLWQGATRIAHNFEASPSILFDVDGKGMYNLYGYDRERVADIAKYRLAHFAVSEWRGTDVHWIDERFEELAAMCQWLDENKIEARFFIHPFYRTTRETISEKSYGEFRSRVMKIRPGLVDFSDEREITEKQDLYYDKRHYRGVVADEIMARILTK
ncbi:MAG: hypothetical protein ACXWTX_01875 [Gallionella sp.]